MKSRGLAVIICLVSISIFTGCRTKGNLSAGQGKTVNEEAQRVAEKFADLLISKCAGGYTIALSQGGLDPAPFEVTTGGLGEVAPHSEKYFEGYDWMGAVFIKRNGNGVAFEIYKRGGQWFYRKPAESDILIDTLRPIRPECPAPQVPGK